MSVLNIVSSNSKLTIKVLERSFDICIINFCSIRNIVQDVFRAAVSIVLMVELNFVFVILLVLLWLL